MVFTAGLSSYNQSAGRTAILALQKAEKYPSIWNSQDSFTLNIDGDSKMLSSLWILGFTTGPAYKVSYTEKSWKAPQLFYNLKKKNFLPNNLCLQSE